MAGPDDLIIDVEPGPIEGGTPTVQPRQSEPTPASRGDPKQPDNTDLVASLRRQFEDAQRERDEATQHLEQERTLRQKAEDNASQNFNIASKAHWRSVNAEYQQAETELAHLNTAIESTKRWKAEATEHLRAALADEKSTPDERVQRVATANEAISSATAYLVGLEGSVNQAKDKVASSKAQVDQTVKAYENIKDRPAPKKEEPPAPRRKPTADDFIDNAPSNTRQWLRDHKSFAEPGSKDQRKLDIFVAQWLLDHSDDRNTLNTHDFVSAVDDHFFPKEPKKEAKVADDDAIEVRQTPAAAPVSRTSVPSVNAGGNRIKLTQEQYAIAPQLYTTYDDLSPEAKAKFPAYSETAARWQYFQDLQRAEREGRLSRGA